MSCGRRRLRLIENQKQRLATYRKRREGLEKKASQLSSLCGVPIAIISFGPDGLLDTWPNDEGALRDLLVAYRSLDPEKRRKHDLDLRTLLGAQAGSQNLLWDPRLDAMPAEPLRKLANSLDFRLEAINERIRQLLQQCNDQVNNNTNSEQGDDSKCNNQGSNNTSSEQADDSKSNKEGNNNTSSEQGLPPCSNPVVFDPFPINKWNALVDSYNATMHGLGHGLDQSERFIYSPYISIAFDPYLINYEASMGVDGLPDSSSSTSTGFNHAINSSSLAFSSMPSSLLMPPPSTGTATSKNNRAFGSDISPESSLGDFFESSEFLIGGGDMYR